MNHLFQKLLKKIKTRYNKTIILLDNGMEIKVNKGTKTDLLKLGTEVFIYWETDDAVVIYSQSQYVFIVVDIPVFTSLN